ncbi:hypothetical protein A6S26_33070 [Nostoc sp. ATCC 43529]|nr:hypothetical protein A6S26_33070 [Nostoc sp. ATCC 43529]
MRIPTCSTETNILAINFSHKIQKQAKNLKQICAKPTLHGQFKEALAFAQRLVEKLAVGIAPSPSKQNPLLWLNKAILQVLFSVQNIKNI